MNTTKIALGLMVLSVSSLACAGSVDGMGCHSHRVSIPRDSHGWDIGLELFAASAQTDNQQYALITNPSNTQYTYVRMNPEYQWGFELSGSAQFATGNDMTLKWEHVHNSQQDNVLAHSGERFSSNATTTVLSGHLIDSSAFFAHDLTPVDESTVWAKYAYALDVINAEFGQHIDVGHQADLRVHAGLQYARIAYTKSLRFSTGQVDPDTLLEIDSGIEALGARVGADGGYDVGRGFSAVGHAAFSLLVGEGQTQLRAWDDSANAGTLELKEVINGDNAPEVIPAALLKTGVHYASGILDGHLSFEGGWRWEAYFHSVRFADTLVGPTENLTLSGPYVAVYYAV